jgi:DnaJ domain
MENEAGLYEILGIDRHAAHAEVRSAFRMRARELHPDSRTGDSSKFDSLLRAYSIISNSRKRRIYDSFGDFSLPILNEDRYDAYIDSHLPFSRRIAIFLCISGGAVLLNFFFYPHLVMAKVHGYIPLWIHTVLVAYFAWTAVAFFLLWFHTILEAGGTTIFRSTAISLTFSASSSILHFFYFDKFMGSTGLLFLVTAIEVARLLVVGYMFPPEDHVHLLHAYINRRSLARLAASLMVTSLVITKPVLALVPLCLYLPAKVFVGDIPMPSGIALSFIFCPYVLFLVLILRKAFVRLTLILLILGPVLVAGGIIPLAVIKRTRRRKHFSLERQPLPLPPFLPQPASGP